jgi:SAM-dependent methyltransferase
VPDTQTWSTETYDRNARFVSDLGAAVLDWLDPKPGERILDLGCGDGALTQRLVELGAKVVGVDASEEFVDAARARGLDARLVNGEALAFDAEFDAVFSNAALHWMVRGDAVVQGVRRALKDEGRFVAEFGGHGNVAAIVTALHAVALRRGADAALAHPWYFPTAEEYQTLLEANGFEIERIALFPRPTPLPTGIGGWLETFRGPFFDQFSGAERAAVIAEVETLLVPSLQDRSGRWTADYVRLRVAARLR